MEQDHRGDLDDHGEKIKRTASDEYILLGRSYESVPSDYQIRLFKIDGSTGNIIWDRSFGGSDDDFPADLRILNNGDLVVCGASRADTAQRRAFIMRTNENGQVSWFNYVSPIIANDLLTSVQELPDGNLVAAGSVNLFKDTADVLLVKMTPDGNLIFRKRLDFGKGEYLNGIFPLPGGRLLGTGFQQQNGAFNGLSVRFRIDGSSIDTHLTAHRPSYHAVQFARDSIVVTGAQDAFRKAFFQVLDTAGRWGRIHDLFTRRVSMGFGVAPVSGSAGFFIVADEAPQLFVVSERSLIYKVSPRGHSDEHFIAGKLTEDTDGDCAYTAGEPPLAGWQVQAIGTDGRIFVALTDNTGDYTLTVPADTFSVSAVPPNAAWQSCGPYFVPLAESGSLHEQPLSALSLGDYAALSIDLGAGPLRVGQTVALRVGVTNRGIAVADSVEVRLSYDPQEAQVLSATRPFTALSPDTLLFQLPTDSLASDQTYRFNVNLQIQPPVQAGAQTYQFRGDVTAKNDLSEAWVGPILQVKGQCMGDSVVFEIRNKGVDMQNALEYIVVEDNVMGRAVPFQLPGGGRRTFKVPANGSTWRIIVPQQEGFPNGRFSTHAVEGCVAAGSGVASTGFIMQFPEADQAPQTAIFSAVAEPNAQVYKRGFPAGCGEERRIAPGTPLEYQITFALTDTDRLATILDTIPPGLDPASFVPGISHAPYTYSIDTDREGVSVARFQWANTNAQDGFVRYRLNPYTHLPAGTALRNRAMLHVTNNQQVTTAFSSNTTPHLVDTAECQRRPVAIKETGTLIRSHWSVTPNPTTGYLTLQCSSLSASCEHILLRITDLAGGLQMQATRSGRTHTLDLSTLPRGMYWLHLWEQEGRTLRRQTPLKVVILE